MSKRAPAEHPIHDLVAQRWSPVVFSEDGLEPKEIRPLGELKHVFSYEHLR